MKISNESVNYLKKKLLETICYVSYDYKNFLITKPVTQISFLSNNHVFESDNESIEVFSLLEDKKITIKINDLYHFKCNPNLDKSINKFETFKKNCEQFKSQYIENLSNDLFNQLICIDQYFLEQKNGSYITKDLFISKNLYMIKFADFLKFDSILDIISIFNNDLKILTKLKQRWIQEIEKSKESALKFVDEEINQTDDENFKTSLYEIKNNILQYDYTSEINDLQSIDEVLNTWPTLFLPAPEFTDQLSKYHRYGKL